MEKGPRSLAAALMACALCAPIAALQGKAPQQAQVSQQAQVPAPTPPPAVDPPLNAAQIQRCFEPFTVLQAQEPLDLPEAQYGRGVTRPNVRPETNPQHLR